MSFSSKYGLTEISSNDAMPITTKNSHDSIAEAAYYKAEKRGFTAGYELVDWLEAEHELTKVISSNMITHA